MRSAPVLLSSFLASHTSTVVTLMGILLISILFSGSLYAQTDSSIINRSTISADSNSRYSSAIHLDNNSKHADTPIIVNTNTFKGFSHDFQNDPNYFKLTPAQKKKRIWLVGGANVIGYSGVMIALASTWYSQYDRTGFHTFNDFPEWKQVDKVGHFYSAYIESRASMEMWRWTGVDRKKRIWIGGMSGAVYQTVIEILDGYSAGWGWSWGDFGANILGSSALVAQELAWNDQRIKFKFSFHRKNYSDPELDHRSDVLFGTSDAERLLKDYNGQTYWASMNLKPFFKNSNLPDWLSVSVGYGAEGLFGGRENIGKDDNGTINFNRPDVKRYRQWFLSPDIDLTKIKTNKSGVKFLFKVLSAFKFPMPSLEFSNGKFKAHALHF